MNRPCLSGEELAQCARGGADDTDQEGLLAHLEACEECRLRFQELCESLVDDETTIDRLTAADLELLQRVQARFFSAGVSVPSPVERFPDLPGLVIEACIGEGGQASVYRARQTKLDGRVVAVKVLGHAGRAVLRSHLARFRNEAAAYARLDHPQIVRLYDVAEHEGCPYLILEYVDGGTLRERIDRERFTQLEVVKLVEGLARTVHFAHEQGVIHRDLKPRNILMTKAGVAKVTDFGLARFTESDSDMTHTSHPLGTKEYMSPEQASGRKDEIGPATDVYALGVILYELLGGRPPFLADDLPEIVRQIRDDDPPSLRGLRRELPRDLETICLKCLRKRPVERYASAEQLADDLRAFQEARPLIARPPGPVERLRKAVRRNRGAVMLVAALLLGLITTTSLAVWAFQAEQGRRQQLSLSKVESGRLYASRGQWPEAVEALEEALALPFTNPGPAHLELANIHLHLSDSEAAREQLVLAERSLGKTPKVLLTEATLLETTDPEQSRAAAQAALDSKELSAADAAFAQALTATTLAGAIDNLKSTLEHEPWHLSAARMQIGLLLLSGRFDEARAQAKAMRLFHASDRSSVIVDAIEHAARGRPAEARQALAGAGDSISPAARQDIETLIDVLARVSQLDIQTDEVSLAHMLRMAQDLSAAWLRVSEVKAGHMEAAHLPPGLKEVYTSLFQDAVARSLGVPQAMPFEEKLVKAHRDGLTLHLRGLQLVSEKKFAEAAETFHAAVDTPSLVDMRRANHFLALRCDFQIWKFSDKEEKARRKPALVSSVHSLLELQESKRNRLFYAGQAAWQTGELDLLKQVADRWRVVDPQSPAPDLYMGYHHFYKQQFAEALRYALAAEQGQDRAPPEFAAEHVEFDQEVATLIAESRKALEKESAAQLRPEKAE